MGYRFNIEIDEETDFHIANPADRVMAYIIDGLLLVIVTFFSQHAGLPHFISSLLSPLIFLLYKLFLEYRFGTTLGKSFFRLKVLNSQYTVPNLNECCKRNILFIVPNLFLIITLFVKNIALQFPSNEWVAIKNALSAFQNLYSSIRINSFLLILDALVMFFDSEKKSRAAHDLFANTFVVKIVNNI
ncbi:MAG TPA: RDD family protein [Cytophagaceae bacterium]|jgi:uncharacterized RDD family membrane protein YckC